MNSQPNGSGATVAGPSATVSKSTSSERKKKGKPRPKRPAKPKAGTTAGDGTPGVASQGEQTTDEKVAKRKKRRPRKPKGATDKDDGTESLQSQQVSEGKPKMRSNKRGKGKDDSKTKTGKQQSKNTKAKRNAKGSGKNPKPASQEEDTKKSEELERKRRVKEEEQARIEREEKLRQEREKLELEAQAAAKAQKLEQFKRIQEIVHVRSLREKLRDANSLGQTCITRQQTIDNKRKLVSDIKKTTGFVKKSRAISEETFGPLVADVSKLNLSRYRSEVVSALAEAPIKPKDIRAVAQVASAMHQHYDEFTEPLLQALEDEYKELSDVTEQAAASRRRVIARLVSELYVAGLVDGNGLLVRTLVSMTRYKEQRGKSKTPELDNIGVQNMKGVNGILKSCGPELLGRWSRTDTMVFDACQNMLLSKEGESEETIRFLESCSDLLRSREPSTLQMDDQFRARLNEMLDNFLDRAIARLYHEHESVTKLSKRIENETINRGTVSTHSKERFDAHKKLLDRLTVDVGDMCDALGRDPPEFSTDEDNAADQKEAVIALWDRSRQDQGAGELSAAAFAYGDESTRSFYEDIPDLRAMLPAALFGEKMRVTAVEEPSGVQLPQSSLLSDTPKLAANAAKGTLDQVLSMLGVDSGAPAVAQTQLTANQLQRLEQQRKATNAENNEATADGVEADTLGQNSPRLEELLDRLPNCLSKEATDQFAVEFCHIQTKNSRRKLVQTLASAPWSRPELLPYYARIAVILSKAFKGIGPRLMEILEAEFRRLGHNKNQFVLETRLRNARFIGELVKFNGSDMQDTANGEEDVQETDEDESKKQQSWTEQLGAPPSKAFYVLNTCFKDFKGQKVDVACALLETCGRYLHRSHATHQKMEKYLETLLRHRAARNLTPAKAHMIENAYYYCIPPVRKPKGVKNRSDEERFIRFLFYEVLGSYVSPSELLNNTSFHESKEIETLTESSRKAELWSSQVKFCVEKLRKLDWRSFDAIAKNSHLVASVAVKLAKKKYDSIPLACQVIAGLSETVPQVGVVFTNLVTERLSFELEVNNPKSKQKRVGLARMVANLLVVGLVEPTTILSVAYFILHYGHALPWSRHQTDHDREQAHLAALEGSGSKSSEYESSLREFEENEAQRVWERKKRMQGEGLGAWGESHAHIFHPKVPCESDPPNDGLRVQLISIIMLECGECLVSDVIWQRLKRFMAYFYRYYQSKEEVPRSIEFDVLDMLSFLSEQRIAATTKRSKKSGKSAARAAQELGIEKDLTLPETFAEAVAVVNEIEQRETVIRQRRLEAVRVRDLARAKASAPDSAPLEAAVPEGGEGRAVEALATAVAGVSLDDPRLEVPVLDVVSDEEDEEDEDGDDSSLSDDAQGESLASDNESAAGGEEASEDEEQEEDSDSEYASSDDEVAVFDMPIVRTEEDEQFEEDFARLMGETLSRAQTAPVVRHAASADNMAVPKQLLKPQTTVDRLGEAAPAIAPFVMNASENLGAEVPGDPSGDGAKPAADDSLRPFRLLKRSNKGKIETRTIHIPDEEPIAKVTQRDKEAEREEQQMIKKYVLAYEKRESAAAIDEEIRLMREGMDEAMRSHQGDGNQEGEDRWSRPARGRGTRGRPMRGGKRR